MFFMHKPKDQASAIVHSLLERKSSDPEMPNSMDAEDAAISALLSALEAKDSASVKQHLRSYLDIYNTSPDSEAPTPPGSVLAPIK
jgi:hypothetical protein